MIDKLVFNVVLAVFHPFAGVKYTYKFHICMHLRMNFMGSVIG